MPAAFSVASSPVTTSGTLTVTGAGTTSQYIRGDGTLATLPGGFTSFDITGGSGSAQTITNGNTVTLAQGTGISTVAGATDTVTISNTLPFNSLTLAGDSGASQSITNNNTITLAGGTGLSSVASATDTVTFNTNVDGTQSVAANTSTTTAARTYKVQVDSSDNLVVNVPWTSGSGGIAGSIATGQVAYATATDTIGGEGDFAYNATTNQLSLGNVTYNGTVYGSQISGDGMACYSNLTLRARIQRQSDVNCSFGFTYFDNDTFTIDTDGSERLRVDSSGYVGIGTTSPSYQLQLSTDSAAKPSSNTWTVVSDERVKTNIRPYETGLQELLQIEPKLFDYNGKAGFDPTTKNNIGVIAQEIKDVMPETVKKYNAKLNEEDKEDTELYNFDSHALTFALINSVKELNAKIENLEAKIQILQNK